MAILTDLMIEIDEGYDNPKFGVSKALSNYTLDEIWNSSYVGANFPVHRMITKSTGEAARYWSTDITRPYTIGSFIYQWGHNIGARIASSGAMDDDEYKEDGIYTKTIWLYSASTIPQTVTNLTSVRMVTQMDFTRFKLKFTRTSGQSNVEGAVAWGDTKSYGTQKSNAYLLDNSDPNNPVWTESGNIMLIRPYQMIKVDDKYCLIDALTPYYSANYLGGYNADTPKEVVTGYSTIDNSIKFGLLQSLKKTSDSYSEIRWYESTWAVNYPSMYENYKAYMQNRSTSQGYNQTVVYPTTQDEFQKNIMGYGVYFETDRTYKPIISGGYVTGYTADLTAPSEIDGYTGSSMHVVPDVKPGPSPGPGPYDDDAWSGVSFSGVGVGGIGAFARCYYMTSTELLNLRTWMSGITVPEGFDPMAQIISLSQVPVALSGDASENIQFINSSAVYDPGITSRVVDSGVASQYSMGTPKRYSLGSVNVTRRMQERGEPYLDYSCQVELYLPLVGVFSLDTQAIMGRTISAEAILDPVSGTLAAYAWVEKDGQKLPVAYGSTTIGVDLPVTAQQYSVAKAALKQANAQLGTSLLSSALTMLASASASGKAASSGGRSSAVGSSGLQPASNNSFGQAASIAASQTMVSQTGNVFGSFMEWGRTIRQLSYGNNTAISGSFGGSAAQWSYPFEAYVKIIRPRFEKPTNYNHSQGVPCVKSMTVGRCTGLIQCIGADVSGITRATDLERQAIQAALTNGVFAGGGQS